MQVVQGLTEERYRAGGRKDKLKCRAEKERQEAAGKRRHLIGLVIGVAVSRLQPPVRGPHGAAGEIAAGDGSEKCSSRLKPTPLNHQQGKRVTDRKGRVCS